MAFTKVIDLTTEAKREQEQANIPEGGISEPENALPPAAPNALPDPLQDALDAIGWDELMPVQKYALPYFLEERELIVQSRTGSGKTGAFLLPLLELLDPDVPHTQALILVPTRELARQVHHEFELMQSNVDEDQRLRAVTVYGGTRYGPQLEAFKKGAHLVVGTPGRVLDHLEKRSLSLQHLRMLILDEADEMLSMGFYPAMRQLKRFIPEQRKSYMFSATMPYRVQQLGRLFLKDPGVLSLSHGQVHVDKMEHRYYPVEQMDKDRLLAKLIELENPDSAIIFCNTKREVEYVAQFLHNYGYDADEISGALSQKAREAVMDRIRLGELRFLVATDVAARGIDISDLSHVFMYDVPQDPEYYIHRAGRTARAGKTGVATTLANYSDEKALLSIGRKYGINLEKRDLPTDEQLAERVSERITETLEQRLRAKSRLENERARRFVPLAKRLIDEGEPELLAMLLDDVYQESLNRPTTMADEPERNIEREEKPPRREGGNGGGRGRRGGGRH